jgi:hypothetical protein
LTTCVPGFLKPRVLKIISPGCDSGIYIKEGRKERKGREEQRREGGK